MQAKERSRPATSHSSSSEFMRRGWGRPPWVLGSSGLREWGPPGVPTGLGAGRGHSLDQPRSRPRLSLWGGPSCSQGSFDIEHSSLTLHSSASGSGVPRERPGGVSAARLRVRCRTASAMLRDGGRAVLDPEPSLACCDARRNLYCSKLGGGGRGGGGPFFLGKPGASDCTRRKSLRARGLEGSRLRWLSEKARPRSGRCRGSGGGSGERGRRSPSQDRSCVDVVR